MSASAELRSVIASFHAVVSCSQLAYAVPFQTAGSGSIAVRNDRAWLFSAVTEESRLDACRLTASPVIENFVPIGCPPVSEPGRQRYAARAPVGSREGEERGAGAAARHPPPVVD